MPFSEIFGQDTTIAALKRALAADRTAHAYLFSGIEGCGREKTALALVEAIFCGKDDGCGICPACRKVGARQHPDLHIVEPDGSFIKIDQIRKLQRELSLRPFEAPKKACIILEADRLNAASGNALLKTLEEPPGKALLVLITANAEGVLPTILSRCQQLRFRSLPQDIIEELLQKEGISADSARLAASLAGGSVKRALDLVLDEVVSERSAFLELIGSLSLRNITPLFSAAETCAGDKERAIGLLELLTTYFRDVMLLQSGSSEIVNHDLLPLLGKEAARSTPEQVIRKIGFVTEAGQALGRNVNTRLTLDILFMRLAGRC